MSPTEGVSDPPLPCFKIPNIQILYSQVIHSGMRIGGEALLKNKCFSPLFVTAKMRSGRALR
jgi:hypothetical protein